MTLLPYLIVLISLTYLAYALVGSYAIIFGAILIATTVLPFVLLGTTPLDYFHAGIAGSQPRLTTYQVVFVVAALILLLRNRSEIKIGATIPFIVYLFFGYYLVWQQDSVTLAGVVQYLVIPFAWIVGYILGREFDLNGRTGHFVSMGLALLALLQAAFCIVQYAGFDLYVANPNIELNPDLAGRAFGTLSHPSAIGKAFLLLSIIALPLTQSSRRHTRAFALSAMVLSLISFGLTGARANLVAIVIMLLCWLCSIPRDHKSALKTIFPWLVIGSIAGFGSIFLTRQEKDPYGSAREHFNEVAFEQIQMRPFSGTGPNAYVPVVGQFDSLTAEGWPVHNTVLLAVGELGLIGAALLFFPLLLIIRKALRKIRGNEPENLFSKSIVFSIVPLLVIGMTGYGMLSAEMLGLWFFVYSFAYGQINRTSSRVDSTFRLSVENRKYVS